MLSMNVSMIFFDDFKELFEKKKNLIGFDGVLLRLGLWYMKALMFWVNFLFELLKTFQINFRKHY